MVIWESSRWLGNDIVRSTSLKELQESMDRRTGRDMIEIMLNTALNTMKSINQTLETTKKLDSNDGIGLCDYRHLVQLTHYQTTNFRLFQTERVCRRQFQI